MFRSILLSLLLVALCAGPGWALSAPMPVGTDAEVPSSDSTYFVEAQAPAPAAPVRLEPPERSGWDGREASALVEAPPTLLALPMRSDSAQARREYESTHSPLLHLRLCVQLC